MNGEDFSIGGNRLVDQRPHDVVKTEGAKLDRSLDLVSLARPAWWDQARCRGDGPERWIVSHGSHSAETDRLRAVCAQCPSLTSCFVAALHEPVGDRSHGPFRAGVSAGSWGLVHALVRELGIEEDDEEQLAILAAWLVDGELALSRTRGVLFAEEVPPPRKRAKPKPEKVSAA